MRRSVKIILAEARKQHRINYHSSRIYIPMFILPVLQFITAYFQLRPFEESADAALLFNIVGDGNIFDYILLGYTAYMFYRCFVQSAWAFSKERVMGTLELIFLSPASRFQVILGNALSSLFESVWMITVFCFALFVLGSKFKSLSFGMIAIALMSVLIPSICWGMLLNAVFLFSRDTRVLFTILDQPMEYLSGVKIPIVALPIALKTIGLLFPLTWSLLVARQILLFHCQWEKIKFEILVLFVMCIVLIGTTKVLLELGERYAKKTGNMSMF